MNLTIYVPDDLGRQVKTSDVKVSKVCQAALRQALAREAKKKGQS